MDDFASLYNLFLEEKQKLCESLCEVGETLLEGISSFETTISENRPRKNRAIKKEILSTICRVHDLNYEVASQHEDLKKRVCELLQDIQPEREPLDRNTINFTNPFLNSPESPIIETDCLENVSGLQCSQTAEVLHAPEEQPNGGSVVKTLTNCRIPDKCKEATSKYKTEIIPDNCTSVEVDDLETLYQSACSSSISSVESHEKYPIYQIGDEILKAGEECHFCYIKNPGEFYIRKNSISFQQFEEALISEICEESFSVITKYDSKAEAEACVGNYCYAFISNQWYRVEVLDWKSRDDDVPVYLIDYGRINCVHYHYLRIMHEVVTKFPKLAIKCHLASLLSPAKTTWPETSVQKLVELSGIAENKTVTTCYVCKEGDSYAVDLVLEEADMTIGELLVASRAALQEVLEDHLLINSSDEELEDFDNINEAIAGYDAKDESRICPFTNGNGVCFKGPKCKLEHVPISSDGITTDKILTYSRAFVDLLIPPIGSKINILPTAYISTSNFYAQIITNRKTSNIYNDQFQNLVDVLKRKNTISSLEVFKCFPSPGEILLVLHCGEWFRGTCRGHGGTPHSFQIFLVDYGLIISKSLSELRQIREDFLHVPFQAVECVLYNCTQKANADSTEARDFFLDWMNFKTFSAEVINDGDPLMIKMFDSKCNDFGTVLIQYGLAEERQVEDCSPPKDSVLQLS